MDAGEADACTCAVATGFCEALTTRPVMGKAVPSSTTLPCCSAGSLGTVQLLTSAASGISLRRLGSKGNSGTVETRYSPGNKYASKVWPSAPTVAVRVNVASTPSSIPVILVETKVIVAATGTAVLPDVT